MADFWKWLLSLIIGSTKAKPAEESLPRAGQHKPKTTPGLNKPGAFYDEIRRQKLFGPVFSTSEFEGCVEVLKDCQKAGWGIAHTAYALATAYHETAHTMQPIKEFGGYEYYMKLYDISGKDPTRAKRYENTSVGDGAKYCGRGYVQLTWKRNYRVLGEKLGIDLINVPDLALNPDIASDIMTIGMTEGLFTGRKLSDYLPKSGISTRENYVKARVIINGTDKANLIADHAMGFQKALVLGLWK